MPKAANESDLQTLNIEFNRQFQGVMADAAYMAMWEGLATLTTSSTRTNEYGWLDQLKALQWEASCFEVDFEELTNRRYALTNQAVSAGIAIKADDFADDNLGQYANSGQLLGTKFAQHPGLMIHRMLPWGTQLDATAPSSARGFDGQPFFGDHTVANGTTYSNKNDTGAGLWWFLVDGGQPIQPVIYQLRQEPQFTSRIDPRDGNFFYEGKYHWKARYRGAFGYAFPQLAYANRGELTEASLEAAIVAMTAGAVDQAGNEITVQPTILVVPPLYQIAAQKLINRTTSLVGDDNMPINYGLRLIVSRVCGTVPNPALMQKQLGGNG